jgi:hypothetical protein
MAVHGPAVGDDCCLQSRGLIMVHMSVGCPASQLEVGVKDRQRQRQRQGQRQRQRRHMTVSTISGGTAMSRRASCHAEAETNGHSLDGNDDDDDDNLTCMPAPGHFCFAAIILRSFAATTGLCPQNSPATSPFPHVRFRSLSPSASATAPFLRNTTPHPTAPSFSRTQHTRPVAAFHYSHPHPHPYLHTHSTIVVVPRHGSPNDAVRRTAGSLPPTATLLPVSRQM